MTHSHQTYLDTIESNAFTPVCACVLVRMCACARHQFARTPQDVLRVLAISTSKQFRIWRVKGSRAWTATAKAVNGNGCFCPSTWYAIFKNIMSNMQRNLLQRPSCSISCFQRRRCQNNQNDNSSHNTPTGASLFRASLDQTPAAIVSWWLGEISERQQSRHWYVLRGSFKFQELVF